MSERWIFGEDQPVFECTIIILKRGDDFFFASSKQREHEVDIKELDAVGLQKIPREHLFPSYESGLTECVNFHHDDVYIKRPSLFSYRNSDTISRRLLEEARVCEKLMAQPHQNIARYRGCVVQQGRIIGLCFDRYAETWMERRERGVEVNRKWLEGVREGVRYLHTLGLVHLDLCEANIMFRQVDGEEAVIIDFDSCVEEGQPLPAKRGYVSDNINVATFEIDRVAIERIM